MTRGKAGVYMSVANGGIAVWMAIVPIRTAVSGMAAGRVVSWDKWVAFGTGHDDPSRGRRAWAAIAPTLSAFCPEVTGRACSQPYVTLWPAFIHVTSVSA